MAQGFYAIRVKNPVARPAAENGLAQRLSRHRTANSVDNLVAIVHRTTQARLSHHRKVVYRTTAGSSIAPPKSPKTQSWRGLATP